MHARSTFAATALLALAVACSPARATPTSHEAPPDGGGPLRLTEKRYTDDKGRTLVVRFEGEKAKVQATDKDGKTLEVVQIALKDMTVCLPKGGGAAAKADAAKPLCQPVVSVTDGAVLKMGTATCTCYVIGGHAYCYGDTCH